MAKIKKVKLHGPIGAYEHTEDNNPLKGLADNDVIIQDQIDEAYNKLQDSLDIDFDRERVLSLQPEAVQNTLYVNPGTFLCRMPTQAGPFRSTGKGSGLNTRRGGKDSDKSHADLGIRTGFHGMGESQRSSVIFFQGEHVSFDAWKDEDFNYSNLGGFENYAPDPPSHRLDLVCVQGFPSQDQFDKNPTVLSDDNMQPKLVVIKGGGFRNSPVFIRDNRYLWGDEDPNITWHPDWGPSKGVDKYRETPRANSKGITKAKTYGMGLTSIERFSSTRTFGTTPAPDDFINASFHVTPGVLDYFIPIVSSTDEQTGAQNGYLSKADVGLFCVPVAYVKIPKGYSGGTIQKSWVADIRPFFRSTELTLPERQAIANSYNPEATNRFLTVLDSDYQALVDYVMRKDQWNTFEIRSGQRVLPPGNHEGRLLAMETAVARPQIQAAPMTSTRGTFPQLKTHPTYPKCGTSSAPIPVWGSMWGVGPKDASWLDSPGYNPLTGTGFAGDLVYQKGQYIPSVRNYLDRFYHDAYNLKLMHEEKPHESYRSRIYGAQDVLCRRIINRRRFLSYNTNVWGFFEDGDITEYPAAQYRAEHKRNTHTTKHRPELPAKMGDSQLDPNNRYKLQHLELDFEFPPFNPERDAHEECEQVWHHHWRRGKGWSGHGHGGSWTDNGHWWTKCVTIGGGKTVRNELPHMGIPLGYAPYWIDVDALGFAPAAIDALQIEVANCFDTANDWGTFVWYRFGARPPLRPPTNYNDCNQDGPTYLRPYDAICTLDERQTKYDAETASWVANCVGEHQTFNKYYPPNTWTAGTPKEEGYDFIASQNSPGYNGFVLMTNMPIKKVSHSEHTEGEWSEKMTIWWGRDMPSHYINWTTTETGFKRKRVKIKITGPAHRYLNASYLPTADNSVGGEDLGGYDWID